MVPEGLGRGSRGIRWQTCHFDARIGGVHASADGQDSFQDGKSQEMVIGSLSCADLVCCHQTHDDSTTGKSGRFTGSRRGRIAKVAEQGEGG